MLDLALEASGEQEKVPRTVVEIVPQKDVNPYKRSHVFPPLLAVSEYVYFEPSINSI